MDIPGIVAQQAVSSLKMGTSMLKSANNAQQALVEMVAATVDSSRGQNVDISV